MTTTIPDPDQNNAAMSLLKPLTIIIIFSSFFFIAVSWDSIITRSGWGPDDQLRMVQLRDFLNGQSWFDWTQYRMNVPDGAPMHWSRLIEVPLTLFILIFTPIFGHDIAEMIAGTLVPLCGLALTAYMIGRISLSLWNKQTAIIAIILTYVNPAILFQFFPMRIDHHGWQIVLASLTLWTMFWPHEKRGGTILGAALAVWLHISLEGLPITAAFFIYLGWKWVVKNTLSQRLLWSIIAFTFTSFALFLGTQGLPFYAAIYCDSVSPPHLYAIAAAAIIMAIAIIQGPTHILTRSIAAGLAGVSALGCILILAPSCAGGAFSQLDPLVYQYWYVNVPEGLPIWKQTPQYALSVSVLPIMGLFALWKFLPAKGQRAQHYMVGFCALYATILSCLVFRTITIANLFAIPLFAIMISHLFSKYRESPKSTERISLVALMLILVIMGPILGRVAAIVNPPKQNSQSAQNDENGPDCKSAIAIQSLQKLPNPSHILAPFNLSTLILLHSEHHVLASSHHRNQDAMRDQIKIMTSNPDKALTILRERKISHVATCLSDKEWGNYQKRHPNSLANMILQNKPPKWMIEIPHNNGLKVWRIAEPQ